MSYVDTSVIVAALDPLDPRRERAKNILEEEVSKVVSELVLVELVSVLVRRERFLVDIANRLNLSGDEAIIAILLYILKRFNLKYRKVHNTSRLLILGEIYKPIAIAVQLSLKLKLKTLDLLHAAYVRLMKDEGEPIERFLTADKNFEKARKVFQEELGVDLYMV